MEKIYEQIINNFSGGISEDKRVKDYSKYSLTSHFDTFTYPHKLKPQILTEAEETKAFNIVQFLYAPYTAAGAGNYRLFGLGVVEGQTKAAVYMLDVDDDLTNNWAAAGAKNESARANRNEEVFFYYKNYIYVWGAGRYLTRFDTTGADAFNDTYYDGTTYAYVAQPVHHPSDDTAYFFQDNLVHKIASTSWSSSVLTFPTNLHITAACAYGNYLAIACVTNGTQNLNSIVYLWDRDSSLTTLTERIDFGLGEIVHLACLDNRLIAVMQQTTSIDSALRTGKMQIKTNVGQFGVVLNELTSDDVVTSPMVAFPDTRVIKENKLYFPMAMPLNGDTRHGIWAVDSNGRLSLEYVESEATSYEGVFFTGNVIWIAHSDDGSVNRSDDARAYSTTLASVYESLILNGGNSSKTKKLISVGVITEPMPAAGEIVLKYRKDGDLDSTWTTIYDDTTNDDIYHEAINIESSGANLPTFKEIQFQINSYSGVIITGLKFKYEIINDEPSD